jgi:septal ring factor EnvC (AmiA/AmiB activator)
MKEFFKYNFKFIIQSIGTILLIILVIRAFTPPEDKSELLKYKLNQLDLKINDLKNQQKKLDQTILNYKKDILKIDSTITKIKTDRKTINNYYEVERDIILTYDAKKIYSALKKRYNY